ncbi:hypothetical protein D9M68_588220 [compost metagenome]
MRSIGALGAGDRETLGRELDALSVIGVEFLDLGNVVLWVCRRDHQANDTEQGAKVVQIAAFGIGQHHSAGCVVHTLAKHHLPIGAFLQQLDDGLGFEHQRVSHASLLIGRE